MKHKIIALLMLMVISIPSALAQFPPGGTAVWDEFDLPDVAAGSADHMILDNLQDKCTSTLPATITVSEDNSNYDLEIRDNDELWITNLAALYTGSDEVDLTCTVPGSTDTLTKTLSVKSELETGLDGFPYVVKGFHQSFLLSVESLGQDVSGATAWVVNENGNRVGNTCETASTGYCEVRVQMNAVGQFTYYGRSEHSSFFADLDSDDTSKFEFEVVEQVWEIQDFETYTDAFATPSNEFYRGDSLYVKFRVYDDENREYLTRNSNTLEEAFLVGSDGQRYELTQLSHNSVSGSQDDEFYFKLDSIPLGDTVLGQRTIFGFTFDEDQPWRGGAQHEEQITIHNNNPVADSVSGVEVDGVTEIDLTDLEYDLEDESEDLTWTFADGSTEYEDENVEASIVDKILTIFGKILGAFSFDLKLTDSDDGESTASVSGEVTRPFEGLFVRINADYITGQAPLEVDFTATIYGAEGDVTYQWDLDGDGDVDSTESNPTHTYDEEGTYDVRLTITNGNDQASAELTITVNGDSSVVVRDMTSRETVRIGNVVMPGYGVLEQSTPSVSFPVSFRNKGDEELKSVRIRASIPDLGLEARSIGPFNVNPGEEVHERVRIETDGHIEPGYHLVHMTISGDKEDSGDQVFRSFNREVWVE